MMTTSFIFIFAFLAVVDALQFSFTSVTCEGISFQYTLNENFEKQQATNLLINYEDETIYSLPVGSVKNGSGSFNSTLITENGTYPFIIVLSSNNCDVLASDGSCYTDAAGQQLDVVSLNQTANCSENNGSGTNDANDEVPGSTGDQGNSYSLSSDPNDSSATTAAVPDSILSTILSTATGSTVTTQAQQSNSNAAAQATATILPQTKSSSINNSKQNSTVRITTEIKLVAYLLSIFVFTLFLM